MPKFRKKPVVVDAERVEYLLPKFRNQDADIPGWVQEAYFMGKITLRADSIIVRTPEGEMTAGLKDWLIRGPLGEIYPCKVEYFDATYEIVTACGMVVCDVCQALNLNIPANAPAGYVRCSTCGHQQPLGGDLKCKTPSLTNSSGETSPIPKR